MGYLDGFLVTLRQHRLFGGDRVTQSYSGGRVAKKGTRDKVTRDKGDGATSDVAGPPARIDTPDDDKVAKPERLHGRHVLGRYEDGMEKCIGCQLCAGVCPAKCIYVRGADNDPDDPTSPGERFGYVYEINYLRCIHCDLCVEACPTEAITESKLFEFSFTNRQDAIYTKTELLVDDDGRPQRMPWEDWREGEDLLTSGWLRATSSSGDATFEGHVGWSAELGYGTRAPESPEQTDSPHLASALPPDRSEQPDASASEPSDTGPVQPDLASASAPDRSDDDTEAGVGSASEQPDASEASQQHGVGSASEQPDASEASQQHGVASASEPSDTGPVQPDLASASAPDRSDDDTEAGVGSASEQPDASEASQQHGEGSAGTGTRERSEPPPRSATSRTASASEPSDTDASASEPSDTGPVQPDLASASAPDRSDDDTEAGVGSASEQPDASEASQQHGEGSAGTGTRERSEPPPRSATSRTASEASQEK